MLRRLRSIERCTTIALTYAIEAAGSRRPGGGGHGGGVFFNAACLLLLVGCGMLVVGRCKVIETKVHLGTYYSTH